LERLMRSIRSIEPAVNFWSWLNTTRDLQESPLSRLVASLPFCSAKPPNYILLSDPYTVACKLQ
jgi:hypothetical protein